MTFAERDQMTEEAAQISELLKGKTDAEKDQILFELERNLKNGNTLRNDSTGKRTV